MYKLSKQSRRIILDRIKDEMTASYNYRYLKQFCIENGFNDARKFFHEEEEDEMRHADKLTNYLLKTRGDKGEDLPPLEQTEESCDKLSDTIKIALKMEEDLAKKYEADIVETFNAGDVMTSDFLRDMLRIQFCEVTEYTEKAKIVEQMKGEENEIEVEKALFANNNEKISIN